MNFSVIRPGLRADILIGRLPPWLARHPRREYFVAVCLSCPPWADRARLREIKAEALRRSRVTGVRHVVDHVLPVVHPLVCGLTVHPNLRVIPAALNAAKSNDINGELFDKPEQLRML